MRNFIAKLIHIVGDILFPEICVGCHQTDTLLCPDCACRIYHHHTETDDKIIVALLYHDQKVRQLIWYAKYRGSATANRILARYLKDAIIEHLNTISYSDEKVLLLPVPMTKRHQKKRGWNQAEILTRALVEQLPTSFELATDIILKIKETPTQVSCSGRGQRLNNLKKAFTLNTNQAKRITGRLVIIVDDVTTTGATLKEVMREVKNAKPRRLLGAAVARG